MRYSGFGGAMAPSALEHDVVERPKSCPACGSADLTTTSKTVDTSTYWRCVGCGEIWNLSRRDTASRYSYR